MTDAAFLDELLAHIYAEANKSMRSHGQLRTIVTAFARNGDTVLLVPNVETANERGTLLQAAFTAWDIVVYGVPHRLEHRLSTAGVPAVPGGVGHDRFGNRGAHEAFIQLRALAAVVPGDAVGA